MPSRPKPRKTKKSALAPQRGPSGDTLNVYLSEISKYKTLPLAEEQELGRRIKQGDQEAVKKLIESNLRFVVHYAKRYRGLGLSFLDLIHEGNLGLIEAAKRFDPERNVKFISYAVWWVRQAIFHSLSEHTRIFRVPQKMAGQVSKVGGARTELFAELERQPTTDELAEKTKMSREEVESLLQIAGGDLSLSTAVGEDGSMELGDTLEQDTVESVEVSMMRESFNRRLGEAVAHLDEKERQVITLRFGLDGDEPRTLQEIGEQLKLSRERIRQIESKAKEKLRRSDAAKKLRTDLN
ncbi:MAG: RNA polymerase sigma factor RpoD/SigA [Vicinamibacteria bacterium]|nr:RNA polymerase sigma factor RpoD/SigA [Vicinamibacteria bacterium]